MFRFAAADEWWPSGRMDMVLLAKGVLILLLVLAVTEWRLVIGVGR